MLSQPTQTLSDNKWDKLGEQIIPVSIYELTPEELTRVVFRSPSGEPFKLSILGAKNVLELGPKCLPGEELDDDCVWVLQWLVDPALREQDNIIAIHPAHIKDSIKMFSNTHWYSIGARLLTFTGARLREPKDKMRTTEITADFLSWQPGKNQGQRNPRREYLGPELVKDIYDYKRQASMPDNYIFEYQGETFTSKFNKEIRPFLPKVWRLLHPFPPSGNCPKSYIYQAKGFRKTFATLRSYKYMVQYNNPEYAATLTGVDMRHDVKKDRIASKHYIACWKFIEADKYYDKLLPNVVKKSGQQRIDAYDGFVPIIRSAFDTITPTIGRPRKINNGRKTK